MIPQQEGESRNNANEDGSKETPSRVLHQSMNNNQLLSSFLTKNTLQNTVTHKGSFEEDIYAAAATDAIAANLQDCSKFNPGNNMKMRPNSSFSSSEDIKRTFGANKVQDEEGMDDLSCDDFVLTKSVEKAKKRGRILKLRQDDAIPLYKKISEQLKK